MSNLKSNTQIVSFNFSSWRSKHALLECRCFPRQLFALAVGLIVKVDGWLSKNALYVIIKHNAINGNSKCESLYLFKSWN